jgi:hypothetical protein
MKIAPFVAFLSLSICCPAFAGRESVRKVEMRDAPDARAFVEHARRLGDDVYPQILDLLSDGTADAPKQLDIIFREHLHLPQFSAGDEAGGCALHSTVLLNTGFLCLHPENFDALLVHEMAHVAQNYPHFAYPHAWQWYAHWLGFKATHPFRNYPPLGPTYWAEGIADYVCAKLGYTNKMDCPQCNEAYPHYTTGYNCAAAFLLYIDGAYGPDVIRQLNATLRRGAYSEPFFAEATGKTLTELWRDFQETSAYTPIAADVNELHEALGYDNGKPPRDLAPRVEKYFSNHPETRDFFAAFGQWQGNPPEDAQRYIECFVYIQHQPGGEQTLRTLESSFKELHQALDSKNGGLPGDFRTRVMAYLNAHPEIKEPIEAEGWLDPFPLPGIESAIEDLIVARSLPVWRSTVAAQEFLTKLKRQGNLPGWRSSEHGTITVRFQGEGPETYPIDRTFQSRKEGSGEIYVFTVVKDSPESDWKLKRAWETNTKGRLVKEFALR